MRMTLAALLTATALALSACGGSSSDGGAATTAAEAPATTSSGSTSSTPGDTTSGGAQAPAESANAATGEQLVSSLNCLACHRIGSTGAPGPGPDLSAIGDELTASQIAETLRQGPGSMPSFQGVESNTPEDFKTLVEYLSGLRG